MWPESSRAPGIGEEHDSSVEKLLGLLLDTSRVKSRTNSSENMYISNAPDDSALPRAGWL